MALKFIKEQMEYLKIPYEFGQWTSKVQYPYFVGELTEEPIDDESGLEESTLLLTGFHRGNMIDLERAKNTIKAHFAPVYGLRADTDGGAIAVFFDGAFYVPTGEADLKKIQINIKIKQWKGV